jgi:hypothetical protein
MARGPTPGVRGPRRVTYLEATPQELDSERGGVAALHGGPDQEEEEGRARVEHDIYKARIVAAGNRERDDGQDTFSPTVAITALPLFLNIVAIFKMKDRQVDCAKAYTKAPIEKDGIFMRPPAGTPAADDGMVLQLLKNIYGRRVAGRNWFLEVQAFLISLGFSSLELEPCWFYLKTELLFIMLILYVDDILYAYISEDETRATALLESIMQKYEGRIIQDSCFIGIQYVQLGWLLRAAPRRIHCLCARKSGDGQSQPKQNARRAWPGFAEIRFAARRSRLS